MTKEWYASIIADKDKVPVIRYIRASDLVMATMINASIYVGNEKETVTEEEILEDVKDIVQDVRDMMKGMSDDEKRLLVSQFVHSELGLAVATYKVPEEVISIQRLQ